MQGVSRPQLTKLILNVLSVRQLALREFHGRKVTPLSPAAKCALSNGKLGKSFWKRWNSKHKSITQKKQGNVSLNHALNCTREMAFQHLDELADELIRNGIFTDAKKVGPSQWEGKIDTSRVINHDETPQFINYGVDGAAIGLVYVAKGEPCNKLIKENRECVTIEPFVTLAGDILMCHVIFKGKGLNSHMATATSAEKIDNLFISVTENGIQEGKSLHKTYKFLNQILEKKDVRKPVVILSDGHSSRFDFDIMTSLQEASMKLFISPPDTTGLTQLLDQINHSLHDGYRLEKAASYCQFESINCEGFLDILASIWNSWASKDTITKAAKRVGISESGINIEWMQQDKFDVAERLMNVDEPAASTPVMNVSSPKNVRVGSAEYYKQKYEGVVKLLHDLSDSSINLEHAGVLKVQRVKPKDRTKPVRLTQVCGSMEAKGILSLLKATKEEKERKAGIKQLRKKEKEDQTRAFLLCKEMCCCKKKRCDALGLKQCSNCYDVLKSVCSKAACQNDDGTKPQMITAKGNTNTTTQTVKMCLRKLAEEFSSSDSDDDEDWDEKDDEEKVQGMKMN